MVKKLVKTRFITPVTILLILAAALRVAELHAGANGVAEKIRFFESLGKDKEDKEEEEREVAPSPSESTYRAPCPRIKLEAATEGEMDQLKRNMIHVLGHMENKSKYKKDRDYIVQEILSTETTYHKQLDVIVEFMLDNWQQLKQADGVFFDRMYQSVLELRTNSATYLGRIKKFLAREKEYGSAPYDMLAVSSRYTKDIAFYNTIYVDVINKIGELKKGKRLKIADDMKLSMAISTPFQRVPRLVLFMDQLAKKLEDHPSQASFEVARERMKGQIENMNETKRIHENIMPATRSKRAVKVFKEAKGFGLDYNKLSAEERTKLESMAKDGRYREFLRLKKKSMANEEEEAEKENIPVQVNGAKK